MLLFSNAIGSQMSERVADIVDSGKARDAEATGPSEVDEHNGPSRAEAEPAGERSLAGDEFSTNEKERLLPSTPAHKTGEDLALPQPESPPPSANYTEAPPPYVNGHSHPKGVSNGAPPICTPPQLQAGPLVPVRCLQNHRPGNGKHLTTSSYKSQHSIKSTASHMEQSAGEDCCVHCILACLFCEFLSLCSLLVECAACGRGCGEACCCGAGPRGGGPASGVGRTAAPLLWIVGCWRTAVSLTAWKSASNVVPFASQPRKRTVFPSQSVCTVPPFLRGSTLQTVPCIHCEEQIHLNCGQL
ncbi:myoD family inhibitor [Acipenser oxyrinchus oxyrinchus]|uniref:MyoD family inhibitor n=1 Tax=Acipenser oxyrinchus oxyrinchus TaxID=40147 RepID=A0AAD8CFS3_ACIOX|nr:myoD family inhibitor [Acipenser oxyrinchus oxyrinchus]